MWLQMSSIVLDVTVLQRRALNLLCNVWKFHSKSIVTCEVLMTVQKHFFNLVLKSISKFSKVSKFENELNVA